MMDRSLLSLELVVDWVANMPPSLVREAPAWSSMTLEAHSRVRETRRRYASQFLASYISTRRKLTLGTKGSRCSRQRDQGRRRQSSSQLQQCHRRREDHRDSDPKLWPDRYPHQQCWHPPGYQLQEHERSGLGFDYRCPC